MNVITKDRSKVYCYQNERCHASALEVNPMDNCVDNCMVQTSQETICNTFKPSQSNFT